MKLEAAKPLSLGLALLAVILVAVVSWMSYAAVGDGVCGGSGGTPNLSPTSGAAAWCRFVDPGWNRGTFYGSEADYERLFHRSPGPNGPLLGPPSTLVRVRESLPLTVPIVLILSGTILALWRRNRRYFGWFGIASVVALLAPWLTIAILAA